MNLPNKLSVLRLILIPVFIAVFYWQFDFHYLVACVVFAVSAFTDFLDGHIARKYNMITDLGKFLDSSADKVLVLAALVIICDAGILPKIFCGIGVSIILAREILISCLRMVAASKGLVMAADKFGKIKTLCQDITIIMVIVYAQFMESSGAQFMENGAAKVLGLISIVLFTISVLLTITSGLHYFIRNKRTLAEIDR